MTTDTTKETKQLPAPLHNENGGLVAAIDTAIDRARKGKKEGG